MRNRVLAVLALLAAWGVTVLAQEDEPVRSEAVSGEETLAQGDQVDLVKITKERIPMDKRLLSLCIGPQAAVGPHSAAEVDVFVNSTVIDYRSKTPDSFSYPVGAKFVKKKYPKIGAKTPDMATVMVKKANTGKVTDWEFSMVRLSDGKPLSLGGRISCADCHERYAARGYISSQSENALQEYLRSLKQVEHKGADQSSHDVDSNSEVPESLWGGGDASAVRIPNGKHAPAIQGATGADEDSLVTLRGTVIEKPWRKILESWNAGGSEYYVLDVGKAELPSGCRSAREGVILRPSKAVRFEQFREYKYKRVVISGKYVDAEPHKPADPAEQMPMEPEVLPVSDGKPVVGTMKPARRGSGFEVHKIDLSPAQSHQK